MPRTVADQPIHTRTGRARLSVRGKPYFRRVTDAIAIGYRKPKTGPGRWVIRERKADGEYVERAIPGVADDLLPGNGEDVLGYDQAVAIATQGVKKVAQDISVTKAVDEWADSKVNATDNPKRISDIRSEARRISAPFANVTVKTLKAKDIEKWRDGFLEGHEGEEARRRRRATANRSLANLKAALTGACKRHGILLDYRPWDAVSKFGKVEAFGKRVITLSDKEEQKLVAAAEDEALRNLIVASFLTGARYGELASATVADLNGNRLRVRGKTGERSVVLSPDAAKFFAALAKGVNDLTRHLLVRADGTQWKDHDQWKPFIRAVAAAGLNPDTTLYAARHSYITRALSKGIPITAIAKQCGTSVKMIEETYSNFTAKELDAMFAFASRPN